MKRWLVAGLATLGLLALDQASKLWAAASLPRDRVEVVISGFFELHYTQNRGAFFSLGAELGEGLRRVLFIGATILAVGLMGRLYAKSEPRQGILRAALVMLTGGALGNLVDRVRMGEVIDFLHLYWTGVFDWATGNLADVGITAGLVLLLVDLVVSRAPAAPARTPTEEGT